MKGLKIASLAMASLMALSLVGCGPVEDPKVRFLRECKQSLSADECQQLAYNKSQEEQARIMKSGTYNSYANQPGGYNTSGYATTPSQPQYQQGYAQPQYGQPGYVQPNNGFADTATGAVVGLAAGAAIGHAIGSSNNNRNVNVNDTYNNQRLSQQDRDRQERDRVYQQQVKDANQYRANPVPAYTDTNKVTRFAAPSTPAQAPAQTAQPIRQSVFNKPPAAPAPTQATRVSAPAPRPSTPVKSVNTARPSVFKK